MSFPITFVLGLLEPRQFATAVIRNSNLESSTGIMENYDREPFVYESETTPGLKFIRRSTYSLLVLKEILQKIIRSKKINREESQTRDEECMINQEPLDDPFSGDLPISDPVDERNLKERRTTSRLREIERLLKRLDLITFRLLDELRTIKDLLKALRRRIRKERDCFCDEMRLYALEDRYFQTLQSTVYFSRLKVGLNREKVGLITSNSYCEISCYELNNELENLPGHNGETQ